VVPILRCISVSYRGQTVSVPVEIKASTDPSDLRAESLLDDEEVRYLLYAEGGFHLKGALARLSAVEAFSPPSPSYCAYARYALGLAYARAGTKPCGGIYVVTQNIQTGERLLTSSLGELPTTYLKKRAAFWLSRCSRTKGDSLGYGRYKKLYDS
jgi:hypothetical protein